MEIVEAETAGAEREHATDDGGTHKTGASSDEDCGSLKIVHPILHRSSPPRFLTNFSNAI
jgi:hypothetical protein